MTRLQSYQQYWCPDWPTIRSQAVPVWRNLSSSGLDRNHVRTLIIGIQDHYLSCPGSNISSNFETKIFATKSCPDAVGQRRIDPDIETIWYSPETGSCADHPGRKRTAARKTFVSLF
ncbi:hypothetical protein [Parvibaculum sp.]|uniref:hypothetical protein n=1 Tax=Parvibaculum sp. TaxID=2024848 RepID=UPI0025E1D6D6|nr:hypothetical protein [Parvibaculum sp.]